MPEQIAISLKRRGLLAAMMHAPRMRWFDAAVLAAGYVALDWASYIHPLHGLNITPWNPAPALGLVYFLRFGWWAAPPIAAAIVLGDLYVRDLSGTAFVSILVVAMLLALGYGATAAVLRHRLQSTEIFQDRRGFLQWLGVVTIGTFANSLAFSLALASFDLIATSDWPAALARYWIGDGVGILVTMPIFWMLADERGRAMLRAAATRAEAVALVGATGIALWVAFGVGAGGEFKYFYVLFLPIVGAAARLGLAGAVLFAALVQVGIVVAVDRLGFAAITVFEVQILTLVLALLGFFVGIVIDEQKRISADLRQSLRLAAAGEMAGALAHELNQPLTAVSVYGSACEKLLQQGDRSERLREAIRSMVSESMRAAEVVRRLRDFFRAGATHLEPISLAALLSASAEPFVARAANAHIRFSAKPAVPCTLLADRVQLQVVMRNLLSNAFDSVSACPPGARIVELSSMVDGPGRVCIRVEDSGSGMSGSVAARAFEPFQSTKSNGLGLGLAISRAVVEAHGGSLWAEVGDHGVFKLVLPTEEQASDGNK